MIQLCAALIHDDKMWTVFTKVWTVTMQPTQIISLDYVYIMSFVQEVS